MHLLEQQLEMSAVGELRPHPRNPRLGDLTAIRSSLDANGFYGAIVAQRSTGHILVGNHRYRAALQRGAERLPVLWIHCGDEAALRILLSDNRTSDLADYDAGVLTDLLRELSACDVGLEGTGFSGQALAELEAELADTLPEITPAEDQSSTLPDAYQILIACRDEGEQQSLLERFLAEGLSCRALLL